MSRGDSMPSIKILFTTPRKWDIGSCLIRKITKQPYSHVLLLYGNKIYESGSKRGVSVRDLEEFIPDNIVTHTLKINVTECQLTKILATAKAHKGKKYGHINLFGALIYLKTNGRIKIFHDGRKTFHCSEFIGEILDCILPDLGKDLDFLKPEDIKKALEEGLVITNFVDWGKIGADIK